MTLQQVGIDLGVALTLATNVVGFARAKRGQDQIKVSVNGKLGWYIARSEQLVEALHRHGVTPPAPETPVPGPPADTIDP
jgi:hypothetical protein